MEVTSSVEPREAAEPHHPSAENIERPSSEPAAAATKIFGYALPWRVAVAGVLALAALLFFPRLGTRALWSSEFRWAEIAREMLLSSRYFWPTINGHVYFDKPLGSYWLALGATKLTGGLNETSVRLPSAIAGLLGVWFLMLIGRRLYGERTALLAGLVLATSFSFVFFSRNASADVETVAGELAALLLFLRNEQQPDGWWVIGLWLVMAVTSLTKGLLGFVLPLLVIGSYSCLVDGWGELGRRLTRGSMAERTSWLVERNRWLFNWKSLLGIALGGAVYYVPFAISAARTGSEKGLEMVYRENIVRFFHPFDHRGPIYLYVYVIFALMMPWSAFLPAALTKAHGSPSDDGTHLSESRGRFVLAYFWVTFIFFTLAGSRRSYYLLPILPAGALLVARMLTTPTEALSPLARRLLWMGYAVVAAGIIGAVVVMLPPAWILRGRLAAMPPAPHTIVYAFCWLISVATVIYALRHFEPRRVALSTATTGALFLAYLFIFAMPAANKWRGEKHFARDIRAQMGPATSGLVLYRTVGPLYYLNLPHPLPYYDERSKLSADIPGNRIRWIIVRRRDLSSVGSIGDVVAGERVFPFESGQHVLNKEVLLAVLPHARF